MLSKIIKSFLKLFFLFRKFQFIDAFKKHNKHSKNVVIVYPDKWRKIVQYIYSDAMVSDLALITAVIKEKGDYRLQFGLGGVESIRNANVFYNISGRFNIQNLRNYNTAIVELIDKLESKGNQCIPFKRDVLFWENKAFMHQEFDRLDINTPETIVYNLTEPLPSISIEYPLLIKEVHSKGAEGIYKVNNHEELIRKLSDPGLQKRNSHVLIQKLLDINKDIRIVCVGDEVIYHHWRMNEVTEEWEPTTYKKGRRGDFDNFPETWRAKIMSDFQKLDIVTGGFDLTWDQDDMSQPPSVLEVSSSYFPNPKPPVNIEMPYGDYKHRLIWFDSWEKNYVDQAFRVKQLVTSEFLRRLESGKA